ncbi:hypothetical protein [Stenotrophomonas sp. PS02297]|uniref:hypothetical protein n=1 Tax=Stenotrophomonas sp. PS02297 TaxID=2991423 RepID=UPI002499C792|nr:hypothetical protein [Stenotrophomonas sp. PS02297]
MKAFTGVLEALSAKLEALSGAPAGSKAAIASLQQQMRDAQKASGTLLQEVNALQAALSETYTAFWPASSMEDVSSATPEFSLMDAALGR